MQSDQSLGLQESRHQKWVDGLRFIETLQDHAARARMLRPPQLERATVADAAHDWFPLSCQERDVGLDPLSNVSRMGWERPVLH
jgi:hypothetical protein